MQAFLSAWKEACETDGGALAIPSGTYLISGANFEGPCNGETYFQNMGTIKAPAGSHNQDYWISFREVDGLTINGRGTFDGNGASAWPLNKKSCKGNCGHRPSSIKVIKVKNLNIVGISSLNSKQFHFHIVLCENVIVNNVNIRAPGDSPNTDGIHVSRCSNVSITNSRIATGDDCISLGDGIRNINIESILCGPGHGISIGSLGKYENEEDVTGVNVKNCTLINTTNGLRIKTWAPSSVSTTVSDVTFEDINVVNVQNPISINQFYCLDSPCSHEDSDIQINGVKYINIKGTSGSAVALNLQCSRSQPCRNLEFHGLRITTHGGQSKAICSSAQYQFEGEDNPSNCGHSSQEDWFY
ncbi:exopolygalacturonase [Phtheirospermum japonicum]|uniref:Exopolygalacturonase n=1 Tax=Phtheirospermum japonicum TaxID=374723 RepID=A0A830BJ84_9LAMI|nr:exopolygalacturonase [Phtheirospermum japonicum]